MHHRKDIASYRKSAVPFSVCSAEFIYVAYLRCLRGLLCTKMLAVLRAPWKPKTAWRPLTSSFLTRRRELEEVQLPTQNQEIQMMNNLLKSDPQLSIITGSVSSGKSVLLRKVIMELKKREKTPVLYIN